MLTADPSAVGSGPPGSNYSPVGNPVRTQRVNSDGTFTPIVTITATSNLYGVQFTFSMLATTYDNSGGPPAASLHASWVDQICGHAQVIGFRTEQDQAPDGVLYNYGVITVGQEGNTVGDEVRVRMDHLNDPATFQAIDDAWALMQGLGVT